MESKKARFVKPKLEPPQVIYQNEILRVVKRRTQIPTGEWNKELIIEASGGTDALGNDRWVELSPPYLKKHILKRSLHEYNWNLMQEIAELICKEEKKEDYDYIFYINRGRYRVKGEIRNDSF